MNITSVQSTVAADMVGITKKSTATTDSPATTSTATEDLYTSKVATIAAKYDPSNISLDQVPNFANELVKNGLISGTEGVVLSSLPIIARHLKGGESMGLDASANGSVNLLQFSRTQFQTAQSFGKSDQLADQQKTIDTITAISAYEQGAGNSSVDAQRVMDVLDALMSNRKG